MAEARARGPGAATPALLEPLHHYDGHKVICTADEKKTASMISGHTWNIINNTEGDEVYLRHARNSDHYLDIATGRHTHDWMQKKGRRDSDGDGVIDAVDSSNFQETLVYPADAGKEDAHLRKRQAKQLYQMTSPRDYGRFAETRRLMAMVPPTPERRPYHESTVPFQGRLRDIPARSTPRIMEKSLWTPRRENARPMPPTPRPPGERDMFRSVDQLRAESYADVGDKQFAEAIHASASRTNTLPAASGALAGTPSVGATGTASCFANLDATVLVRSQMPENFQPKPAHERTRHSRARVEPAQAREVTAWPFSGSDKLKRDDPYFVRPVQATGSSCVKYDIITGDRKQFWY